LYLKIKKYLINNGSLNSDGQQFNQYQQNRQPPLAPNHWEETGVPGENH
jgi:hypothetical protein